jgi:hypothetical protein
MTTRPPLDPQTTDRLVSGLLAPDDAPPGYRHMAQLFSDAKPAARQPVQPAQIDALVDVILTTADPSGRPANRRNRVFAQLLTVKALAVVGALTLGVTAAGAATGSLPHSVQGVAHDALVHVGVHLPDTDDATTPAVTHDEGANHDQGDNPVADVPGDNEGANHDQGETPVAGVPGDDEGANHDEGDNPAADVPGDNEGDNDDQGGTPVAGVPGDHQGDNNDDQGDNPVADVPDDHHGDNNDQNEGPDTTQPDDNQQGDSHGDGGN